MYIGIQHMVAVVYRDDRDSEQGENPSWKADTDKSGGILIYIYMYIYIYLYIYIYIYTCRYKYVCI
jgi:hypothetical protein